MKRDCQIDVPEKQGKSFSEGALVWQWRQEWIDDLTRSLPQTSPWISPSIATNVSAVWMTVRGRCQVFLEMSF